MGLFPMFAAWREKQFGLLESLVDEAVSKSGTSEFRDWEFSLLQTAVTDRSTVVPSDHGYKITRYNHSGQLVALRRDDGTLDICKANPFAVQHTFEGSVQVDMDWHPTANLLAVADSRNQSKIWDAETGSMVQQWATQDDPTTMEARGIAWSPDGSVVALGGHRRIDLFNVESGFWKSGSRLQVWNIAEQRLVAQSEEIVGWHEHMDFEPNGQRIVLGGDGGKFFVVDANTGKILADRNSAAAQIRSIAWSSSGTRLLTSADDCTLRLWDTQTLDLVATFSQDFGACADWNANGQQIATCTQDGLVRFWASQ